MNVKRFKIGDIVRIKKGTPDMDLGVCGKVGMIVGGPYRDYSCRRPIHFQVRITPAGNLSWSDFLISPKWLDRVTKPEATLHYFAGRFEKIRV